MRPLSGVGVECGFPWSGAREQLSAGCAAPVLAALGLGPEAEGLVVYVYNMFYIQ